MLGGCQDDSLFFGIRAHHLAKASQATGRHSHIHDVLFATIIDFLDHFLSPATMLSFDSFLQAHFGKPHQTPQPSLHCIKDLRPIRDNLSTWFRNQKTPKVKPSKQEFTKFFKTSDYGIKDFIMKDFKYSKTRQFKAS